MSHETRANARDEHSGIDITLERDQGDTGSLVNQVIAPGEESDYKKSGRPKPPRLMNLLLHFLDVPGTVMLIDGAPGTGKTSLALEILNQMEDAHKVYASSRVSPERLRQHFPWINEVIDSMSGRTARSNWLDEFHDFRSAEPDSILSRVLRLKHSKHKALFVIDSWEGAVRNVKEEARRQLETALLSELDESRVSVVIVTETDRHDQLGYMVDGIVNLSQSDLEGRRTRVMEIRKLRGFKVSTLRALFSLDGGRFTLFPAGPENGHSHTPAVLVPTTHGEGSYSTGIPDLDRILDIKKGTLLLMDVDSNLPPDWLRPVMNIINANFVNQGGACFIVPSGGYSSENVAEELAPLVGEKAMNERVRIAAYSRSHSPMPWRVQLSGKLLDDVRTFTKVWESVAGRAEGSILNINLDRVVAAYGENLSQPGFAEIGEGLRDAGALQLFVSSLHTKVRDDVVRNADYHLKLENKGGSLLIYGVKRFTPAYAARVDYDRGYPRIGLTPVV